MNGAKLLGPFNQVGGTCFGFTNAINNWGRPLSFLSSDYNFGGLINGQGEVSEEFYEARLLSNFIRLFGEKLGQSRLIEKEVEFIGKEDVNSYPHILGCRAGAVTAQRITEQPESIRIRRWRYLSRTATSVEVPQAFLLWNTPLISWASTPR